MDEVGNSDLGASHDPNHRYLSLTGVILELEYVAQAVFPALEDLKQRYFGSHPDDPVILHRKELVNKKPPFESLLAPATRSGLQPGATRPAGTPELHGHHGGDRQTGAQRALQGLAV